MATIWIIILTVLGTIFFGIFLLVVFSWGSERVGYNDEEFTNHIVKSYNRKLPVDREWIEESGWVDFQLFWITKKGKFIWRSPLCQHG